MHKSWIVWMGLFVTLGCGTPLEPSRLVSTAVTSPIASDEDARIRAFNVALSGSWAGTTTTTSGGRNGALACTIESHGQSNALQAECSWQANGTQQTYTGAVDGNLDSQVNIHATNDPTQCQFRATGVLSHENTQIDGNYWVNGQNCATTERADGQVKGQSGLFSLEKSSS